ncbi:MAG: RtcB family protein, partial [Syntrophorhabdaceae bacterium]|nr:RtcB family protein [Syntrophorhabdaceae bacterium]
MIRAKQLNELGLPNHQRIMKQALKTVNKAIAAGASSEDLIERLGRLTADPQSMRDDDLLGSLAEAVLEAFPAGICFVQRNEPAPWKKWGDMDIEESAITQMRNASLLPVAVRGALMPDAHSGYGLPIGGGLAGKDALLPY